MKAQLLIVFAAIPLATAVMKFILDEKITICSEKHYVDLTKFEMAMVNDTTTVANGTLVMTKGIQSPWKLEFYGEQFERGKWFKKFERKFDDFCKNILKPGEIWYDAFNKKMHGKGCPYENGQVTDVRDEVIYFDVSFMPFTFQGRWRFTMDGDLGCFRVHFDLMDM